MPANDTQSESANATQAAAAARLYALLRVIEIMFKDPPGVQLTRDLRMVRQRFPPPERGLSLPACA